MQRVLEYLLADPSTSDVEFRLLVEYCHDQFEGALLVRVSYL